MAGSCPAQARVRPARCGCVRDYYTAPRLSSFYQSVKAHEGSVAIALPSDLRSQPEPRVRAPPWLRPNTVSSSNCWVHTEKKVELLNARHVGSFRSACCEMCA